MSFRLKIALLSGLVSGAILTGAGWLLWTSTGRTHLERIDRELENLGRANLERRHGHHRYEQLEQALSFTATTDSEYILHFTSLVGRASHTSSNWPPELEIKSLATPGEYPSGTDMDAVPPPEAVQRGRQDPLDRPLLPIRKPRHLTRTAGGRAWRLAVMGNPYQILILGTDLASFNVERSRLRAVYLTVVPIGLFLIGVGSWMLAGRVLRPVAVLSSSLEGITAKGLDQRIPVGVHDAEFDRLITVFNEMMDRLEKSFRQATRFSADAAHELKTPLTIMQGELEQTLQHPPEGAAAREVFARQLEEVQRLKSITQKLLLLAHADAGRLTLHCEAVALDRMLAEAAEDAGIMAPGLSIQLRQKAPVTAQGDPVLLRQVIQNLVSNAVKYNQEGGWVRMELRRVGDQALFEIRNSGPGIEPAQRERIFDRFYRVDDARSRSTEGVGLGLSLCREIVRAHGGGLTVEQEEAGSVCFRMSLRCEGDDRAGLLQQRDVGVVASSDQARHPVAVQAAGGGDQQAG